MADRSKLPDEAQLIDRLGRDDQSALADLLRLWGGVVRGALLKKYRHSLRETDIEDALSTALYRLWKARRQFDPAKGSLRSWFFRIAENGLRDALKYGWQKARRLETESTVDLPARQQPDQSGERIDEPLRCALGEALQSLPAAQRKIVMADAFSGNGPIASGDLAAELGLTAATVRVYRKRALDALRKELASRGFPGGHSAESE